MGLRRRRLSSQSSGELAESINSFKNSTPTKPIRIAYAKRKKSESCFMKIIQTLAIAFCVLLMYYTYYHFEHFHSNVVHFYATKWDDHHAQHSLGLKILNNRQNESAAFHWFRKSAEKGHPHSAYNLAAGHLSGYQTDVQKGEVKQLLEFAAKHGVTEASKLLSDLCDKKPIYCEH
ncbi:uncharacterized protein LOC141857260 [Brevipalpus obovatus]|uniref:uncharacterized protein LOC141857260 n=1 Tax=Brevipalpus obovatus TaxID=246614 RepID=UPI003D9F1501